MVSERRFLKRAVLKKWTSRQGSPRNLGLAVAQLRFFKCRNRSFVPLLGRVRSCEWTEVL